MQIRLTDVSVKSTLQTFEDAGFGLDIVRCPTREQVETASIWTGRTEQGPSGHEIGLIRRELGTFSTSYEVVLDTGRIDPDRVGEIVGKLASINR